MSARNNGRTVRSELKCSLERPSLEPEIIGTAWRTIVIAIQRRAWHTGANTIQVANRVRFISLGLKLEQQLILALSLAAKTAVCNRGVIAVIAAGCDANIVDTVRQGHLQERVFAEVVIIACDLNKSATAEQ